MASTNQTLQFSPDLHQTVVYRLECESDILGFVPCTDFLRNFETFFKKGGAGGLRGRHRDSTWSEELSIDTFAVRSWISTIPLPREKGDGARTMEKGGTVDYVIFGRNYTK